MAWAFSTARRPAADLFYLIAETAAPRMGDFKPQELSNLAWAYATAQHSAPKLFETIGAEAAARVRSFKSQDKSLIQTEPRPSDRAHR